MCNIWFSFCTIQFYMHGIPSNIYIARAKYQSKSTRQMWKLNFPVSYNVKVNAGALQDWIAEGNIVWRCGLQLQQCGKLWLQKKLRQSSTNKDEGGQRKFPLVTKMFNIKVSIADRLVFCSPHPAHSNVQAQKVFSNWRT